MEILLATSASDRSAPVPRLASLARELARCGADARVLVSGADDLVLRRLRRDAPGVSIRRLDDGLATVAAASSVVADAALGAERLTDIRLAARSGGSSSPLFLVRVPSLRPDREPTGGFHGWDAALAGAPLIRDFLLARGRVPLAFAFPDWTDRRTPSRSVAADVAPVVVGGCVTDEGLSEAEELLLGLADSRGDLVVTAHLPAPLAEELERRGAGVRPASSPRQVREILAGALAAVHLPPRPYAGARSGGSCPFPWDALASGVPLVSLPWEEPDHPLVRGRDFLQVEDAGEALEAIGDLLANPGTARRFAESGCRAAGRHTAARRAERLLSILSEMGLPPPSVAEIPAEPTLRTGGA